jgi:hypothetical protein
VYRVGDPGSVSSAPRSHAVAGSARGQIYNVTQAFVDRGPLCCTMNFGGQDRLAG